MKHRCTYVHLLNLFSRDLDTLLHKVEVITLEITLVVIQSSQWMRKCENCVI